MGISGIPAIPMIITCLLQGTLCNTGIPRTFYGGKICSAEELSSSFKKSTYRNTDLNYVKNSSILLCLVCYVQRLCQMRMRETKKKSLNPTTGNCLRFFFLEVILVGSSCQNYNVILITYPTKLCLPQCLKVSKF